MICGPSTGKGVNGRLDIGVVIDERVVERHVVAFRSPIVTGHLGLGTSAVLDFGNSS